MHILLTAALAQTTGGAIPQTSGQLFRPTIDGTHTLWTDDSGRAPDGYFLARGMAHYARNPVIYVNQDDEVNRIVGDLFQLSVLGGFTKGPIRIGVDIPVYLRSLGEPQGETGLGDIALDVKGSVLDRESSAIGLAFGGRAWLPTTTVDTALGYRGFAWELQAIADKKIDKLLVAGNLGLKGVPREALENFDWGTQFVARLGGGYEINDSMGVSLDFGSHINLAQVTIEATPIEGILGGWVRSNNMVVRGGLGTGLTSGFGSPQFRAMIGVGWEPPRISDLDGDGIVDKDDACPMEPEDFDGFRDEDGCPEPTSLLITIVDQDGKEIPTATYRVSEANRGDRSGVEIALKGGDYTVTVAAEGYEELAPQALKLPDAERHAVTYTLKRLIPPSSIKVVVTDGDGKPIPSAKWGVRGERETFPSGEAADRKAGKYTVRAEAEGYRPKTEEIELDEGENEIVELKLLPAKVELTREKIDIKDSVYFETAKAVIKVESFELLNEVAQIIMDHPELTKIRIEGHTDARGNANYNLELSKKRAASVRDYLIGRGVAPERLESEGFGKTRPLVQGNNEAAWSKNRRVDFFVVSRAD